MDFGEVVRRRRKALELTLEKAAERARISTNYLGSIELGKRDPSLSTVEAIAKALRTSPSELLGSVKHLSPDGYEAGKAFDSLPPDVQSSLLPLLRSLARRRR